MKILLASFFPLPHQGGIWTYVDLLRKGLEARGHSVDVLSRHPNKPIYYLVNRDFSFPRDSIEPLIRHEVKRALLQNVPEQELNRSFDGTWSLLDMETERYAFEIAAVALGLAEYDMLHTQDIIATRALARVKPETTPLVATLHGILTFELLERGAYLKHSTSWNYAYAQECIGASSADRVIVPTEWMKSEFVRQFLLDPALFTVIPHGMEIELFFQDMKKPTTVSRPTNKHVIICPARLEKEKGHPFLLEALAQLKRERDDWQCWLIGDGHHEGRLRQQCADLGLSEDILFLGYRHDVPALLQQADLFVLPSLIENQPFAVMEAQLAGLPILATNVGGMPEMIKGEETGILVPPGQSDPLFRQLNRLLSDPKLRIRLSDHTRDEARNKWSANRMVESLLHLYEHEISP